MVNLESTERLFALYWSMHKRDMLPLLCMVLAASEISCPEWSELIEAYIGEAIS